MATLAQHNPDADSNADTDTWERLGSGNLGLGLNGSVHGQRICIWWGGWGLRFDSGIAFGTAVEV